MPYVLELAYDGGGRSGWQRQQDEDTIQGRLEAVLSRLLGAETPTVAAGRTDAGVHALRQYAHFDTPRVLPRNFLHRVNSLLPPEIAGLALYRAEADFSARFSALSRRYRYQIIGRKTPFLHRHAYYCERFDRLNRTAMDTVAELLFNYNDFACFCKMGGANHTTICHISEARWVQEGELLVFYIRANRFLRGMVRAVVGTMMEVGLDAWSIDDFARVIEGKDRTAAGRSMPAHGLYLAEVAYPSGALECIELPRMPAHALPTFPLP